MAKRGPVSLALSAGLRPAATAAAFRSNAGQRIPQSQYETDRLPRRHRTQVTVGGRREVARVAHLRRVPGAPPGVAGLVNLRGEILCALDARAILGLTALPPAHAPFLIALRRAGDPLGLVVDSIADIYAVAADDIEPAPAAWNEERAACCTGAARIASGLMGLLDVSRLVKV